MHDNKKEQRNLLEIPHYKVLGLVTLTTLLSGTALSLVLLKLDPYSSTDLALSLFFFTSFLTLTGIFSIVLFFIKKWWAHNEIYVKHIGISLRQGLILSLCAELCLLLLMLGLLRIWNGLLLALLMLLIEFYFSSKDEL